MLLSKSVKLIGSTESNGAWKTPKNFSRSAIPCVNPAAAARPGRILAEKLGEFSSSLGNWPPGLARTAVLNSLDVVTTAGALGDVTGALQTLPGTSTNGESGRLFVHGGSADETGTYIDGILVHQPYTSSAPNMAVRGRFNPFMFSGTAFSTGGYSAEYGQAMSSVLVLNTNELQELSISGNIISLSDGNSISLTDTSVPFSAPGASYDLPQGIIGQHIVLGLGNYTVPAGKTLWITSGGPNVKLKGLGVTPFALHPTTPNMPVLPSSGVVQDCMCTGILIANTENIEPKVINFINDGSTKRYRTI